MQRDLDEIASPATFSSDVCVIGGGIAGLIVALKLARLGCQVILLEAGGMRLEERSQALYAATMDGVEHRGTSLGRFRTFGGSSTRWAGQLLPYPEEVFEARPAVNNVGWPISAREVMPYYEEVRRIMGVNAYSFGETFLQEISAPAFKPADAVRVRFSKWAPPSRRNLSWTLGRDCLASERVTVFLHANAVALEFETGRAAIARVNVVNYGGGKFSFTARQYVVATGTLETCRLLLNSRRGEGAAVGDATGQLGRYFFDHVSCIPAQIAERDYPVFRRVFSPYYRRRTLHTVRLENSRAFQEKHGCLAVMAHFEFLEPEGSGLTLARGFMHDVLQGRLGSRDGQKFSDLPKAALGAARTFFDLRVLGRRFPTAQAHIFLRLDFEQVPDAASRIHLATEPDALGVPKLRVEWRRSEEEARAAHLFAGPFDAFCRAQGLELNWEPGLLDDAAEWMKIGKDIFHPMGGARMGVSPANSVVNADLRLHEAPNGYVASCAVYPTGGSSNPTFTLMALCLRLADHLNAQLGRGL